MIRRNAQKKLSEHLSEFPAVALLGPRQVGKTTLAMEIAETQPNIYLDLESPHDLQKLSDPITYLRLHEDKLVILDEVQRAPDLFQVLRGLIDEGRRKGLTHSRFLLLGSASIDLLKQSGESLAGRITYLELSGLSLTETGADTIQTLWLQGGFPDSFLAKTPQTSMIWRENFIRTYLERDIPALGPRIPAETLRRFWTMLAHNQGTPLNAATLAKGLAVAGSTIARYLDLLQDLLLVRKLQPWHSNTGKRLTKSPKVFVRDSGLLHTLLGIVDSDNLLSHPVVGMSWEGFVIENIINMLPFQVQPYFYRTSAGAEMDLVLAWPNGKCWAIEIKRNMAPKPTKGFYSAYEDLQPARCFVVYPGNDHYPLSEQVEVIGLKALLDELDQDKPE